MIRIFILVTVISSKILGVTIEHEATSVAFSNEATCWNYARSTDASVLAGIRKENKDKDRKYWLECRPIDFIILKFPEN